MNRPHPLRNACLTLMGGIVLAFFAIKGCTAYRTLRDASVVVHEKREGARDERNSAAAQSIGMKILKDYASPDRPIQDDLTDMAHALGNFALLVKGDNPLPLGANEEIAKALMGKNKAKLRFLPEDAPCFNAQGQIVDRWGSPLFFHAADRDRIDIRSAGPDKTMWNGDDLHRTSDGRFLSGEVLSAPSLLEAAKARRK